MGTDELLAAEPRPDQWVYEKGYHFDFGSVDLRPGESWERFDGKVADASPYPDEIDVVSLYRDSGTVPSPQEWYEGVAALPADPEVLLDELRESPLGRQRGASRVWRDFFGVTETLGAPVMPPTGNLRLFRALAAIPGVEIDQGAPSDVLGRDVLAVSLVGRIWRYFPVQARYEVLLDPTTYAWRGMRLVALEDGIIEEPDGKFRVTSGHTFYSDLRAAVGIVDRPGQRL